MNKVVKKIAAVALSGLLVASVFAGCSGGSAKDTYTVGICQSMQHPALDKATEGFKKALTDKLGDKLMKVLTGVASVLGFALAFLIFFYLPVLLFNVLNKHFDGTLTPAQGTIEGVTKIIIFVVYIIEWVPNAKKGGILYCSAEKNSKYQATVVGAKLKEMGLEVKEYTAADSNEIASVTKLACQNSDVLYVPTDNTMASSAKTIDNIAKPAGVPIIAGEEGICSGCGIATLSISYYDIGYKAGEMAYDILVNGKDISTMDIEYAPNVTKEYNAAICSDLGITVPDDYVAIDAE